MTKLRTFALLGLTSLILIAASCRTPPGKPPSFLATLPIEEGGAYLELYSEATTLEEKRAVLVMLREDVQGTGYEILTPRIDEEIDRLDRRIAERDYVPPPAPEPTEPDKELEPDCGVPPMPTRKQGSLRWKPKSEGDGRLVILFSSAYRTHMTRVYLLKHGQAVDDPNVLAEGRFAGEDKNGCRPHWRFPQGGASYGQNIAVVAVLKDGQRHIWGYPDGAIDSRSGKRYD